MLKKEGVRKNRLFGSPSPHLKSSLLPVKRSVKSPFSGETPLKIKIKLDKVEIAGKAPPKSAQSQHFGRFNSISGRFST
ncbi:hypothetical protein [Ammoniphilus sp. 3BR4]|uniref:hypothetical protein n=1 Tax=Ammoniphilus sp. 3BR4 TaxID=3158265 RepID=UPI0034655F41